MFHLTENVVWDDNFKRPLKVYTKPRSLIEVHSYLCIHAQNIGSVNILLPSTSNCHILCNHIPFSHLHKNLYLYQYT